MNITDWILILMAGALFVWAAYNDLVITLLRGKTRLKVPLLKRKPVDNAIFIFLIAILIYKNNQGHGPLLTTWLLVALILLALYQGWLRQPELVFKDQGFYYNGIWIAYSRIKQMNLSEDGVLVMQLERRRLLIRVREIDDLEKIYKFMLTTQ